MGVLGDQCQTKPAPHAMACRCATRKSFEDALAFAAGHPWTRVFDCEQQALIAI